MNVEKSISTKEIEVIIRKHFEGVEGVKLNEFKISSNIDGAKISYNTDLIPPSALEQAKEKISGAKNALKSIFG